MQQLRRKQLPGNPAQSSRLLMSSRDWRLQAGQRRRPWRRQRRRRSTLRALGKT